MDNFKKHKVPKLNPKFNKPLGDTVTPIKQKKYRGRNKLIYFEDNNKTVGFKPDVAQYRTRFMKEFGPILREAEKDIDWR